MDLELLHYHKDKYKECINDIKKNMGESYEPKFKLLLIDLFNV